MSQGNEHQDGDGDTQSKAALSMQEIEEAVELISPGLRSEMNTIGEANRSLFSQAPNRNIRLSGSNQVGFPS